MSIGPALLVSADLVTIQGFRESLRRLSMWPEVCMEAPLAIHLLGRRKFDAVIVDLQLGERWKTVFENVHLSASNRTAVTFAISSNDAETTEAFRKGSAFVFERPLSVASICGTLKPAFGLILRERRRYFRCAVRVPVTMQSPTLPETRCQSVNLSEGGMSVSSVAPLKPGEQVRLQFALPDCKSPFAVGSTVRWARTGHLGLRFVSLPQQKRSELQEWLSRKLEEMLPDFVAENFRKA